MHSLSVHHYILGHTPSPRALDLRQVSFTFDLVVDSLELHTGAYPPSLGSSDLLWASLSFDLVVDPHELSYWGMSPPAKFACIVIFVSSGFESLDHFLIIILSVQFESGPHLYRSVIVVSV